MTLRSLTALALSLTLGAADAPAPTPGHAALVAAERAFAKASATQGTKAAFQAWLALDGVIFRPRATPGQAFYAQTQEDGSRLEWAPAFAELSASGDLGYTTGPYAWRRQAGEAPASYGHFVSVWKKQPDGQWRVAADLGIKHPKPLGAAPDLAFGPAASAKALPKAAQDKAKRGMLEAEGRFCAATAAKGLLEAYAAFGAEDLRSYRLGVYPARNLKESRALAAIAEGYLEAEEEGSSVSEAGDLGYIYGLAGLRKTRNPDEEGQPYAFLRVWRKTAGAWRLALDIQVPAPLPPNPKKGG